MILQWGDTSASLKNAIFLFKKNFAQIYRNQPEDRKGFNRPFFWGIAAVEVQFSKLRKEEA